jgi:selenocysteine-specific elongation factor
VVVANGRVRPADAADPLADHPFLTTLRNGGCAPPEPAGIDRGDLRALVQRGLVVERDGLYFHPDAITIAAHAAASLLQADAGGFTVAQLRDALGVTRKYALPIVNELDGRGITRRRGDVRIAGPRLPPAA